MTGKKILVCLLLGVVLAAISSGCGRRRTPAVTFVVGGAPAEIDFWQNLVDEFRQNTGIQIELLRQPTDTNQRRQGLVTSLRARETDPDVFLMDIAWLAQFAASGWLEPLDEHVTAAGFDTATFFPGVVDLADRFEGKLVALPVYVDGGLLYYRKDLLEKYAFQPPQTWQELVNQSKSIQADMRKSDSAFNGFVWQGAQYEGLICNWLEFTSSNGGGFAVSDGRITLDSSANVAATQFMSDLIHTYKISPENTYTEMKEEEVRRHFQEGHALFERNWPYAWSLHQADDSPVNGKTAIAPLPHFEGGRSVSTMGGWHIGLSQYSDRKQEAFEFVKFVLSYDTQKRLALTLGWNPGRRDVYNDSELLAEMPHFAALKSVFENLQPRPLLPYYTLISDAIQPSINSVLAGTLSAEEALAQAQRKAQQIMDQYEKQ